MPLSLWGGTLVVRDAAGRVVDSVTWDHSWPAEPGVAMELVDMRLDNSIRENWAAAQDVGENYTGPEGEVYLFGTPGRAPGEWQLNTPPLLRCDDGTTCPLERCDDGNACTLDVCETVAGCLHLVSDEPCDDGDPCTTDDACEARDDRVLCVGHGALDCGDGDPCTADACDPSLPGGCRNERISDVCVPDMTCPPDCPESDDPCFAFVCGEDERCTLVATQNPCDDDDPCNVEDTCEDGLCRGRAPAVSITCQGADVELSRVASPLCLPEYDAVGYAILGWDNVDPEYARCHQDADCPVLLGDCAEVVCWPVTEQCMILRR